MVKCLRSLSHTKRKGGRILEVWTQTEPPSVEITDRIISFDHRSRVSEWQSTVAVRGTSLELEDEINGNKSFNFRFWVNIEIT